MQQIVKLTPFWGVAPAILHFDVLDFKLNTFGNESTRLRDLRALAPNAPAHLRSYASYPSLIRALRARVPLLSPISALRAFFVLCCVVSIVRYSLRLENPRKATGPDFISLKVIKFASDVINSHLYNIIIEDLEKNKYSEEPKTALVRPIFKKK